MDLRFCAPHPVTRKEIRVMTQAYTIHCAQFVCACLHCRIASRIARNNRSHPNGCLVHHFSFDSDQRIVCGG